jgi:hypothetical protein
VACRCLHRSEAAETAALLGEGFVQKDRRLAGHYRSRRGNYRRAFAIGEVSGEAGGPPFCIVSVEGVQTDLIHIAMMLYDSIESDSLSLSAG